MARAKWVDFVFAVILAIALLFTVKTEAAAGENEGKNVQPIPISINYYDAGDIELYNLGPYEDIYVTEQYKKMCSKFIKEGRLIQASTSIRQFKRNMKLLISHEIIVSKSKRFYKPKEYLTYMTDTRDRAISYGMNLKKEEGFLVNGSFTLDWAGKEVYLVSFSR